MNEPLRKVVLNQLNQINDNNYQKNEIYLQAVLTNGLLLEYISDQTDDICISACYENPLSLQYVKDMNYRIFKHAMDRYTQSFRYVKNKHKYFYLLKYYVQLICQNNYPSD